MIKHFNQFAKTIDNIGRRHGLAQIFNDFLSISICELHRTNIQSGLKEKDQDNEALYLQTIKPYKREELSEFAKMFATLVGSIYEQPYSDLLGEYFMQNISNGRNGQFFTPEPVCELMARMVGPDEETENKRVLDVACGSGRTLLAAAKINPKNLFYGADNDMTCAKMATVNFCLNGLRGEVSCMNSLSMEWYAGWHVNTQGIGIVPITKDQSHIWAKAPEIKKQQEEQLTLF